MWPMSAWGQTRSFGDVRSMPGLLESGHGWAIYLAADLVRAAPDRALSIELIDAAEKG
jgi:hypothetical protein